MRKYKNHHSIRRTDYKTKRELLKGDGLKKLFIVIVNVLYLRLNSSKVVLRQCQFIWPNTFPLELSTVSKSLRTFCMSRLSVKF